MGVVQTVGGSYAAVLASLHTDCFVPADQWNTAAMTSLLGSAGVCAGLVQMAGNPAGFVMLRCVAGEAEILTLCVLPHYRRQGLATQLVIWSLAQAAAQKAEMIFLEVSVGNLPAQKTYTQAGFVQRGVRRAYYSDGSDALVLGRSVQETGRPEC